MNFRAVAAMAIVTLAGPLAGLAWSLGFKANAAQSAQHEAATGIDAAHELIDQSLDDAALFATRVATLVASDSRSKAALSIVPLDKATLRDFLSEVQDESHLDWLAICSPSGEVLATVSERNIEVDSAKLKALRSTPWFEAAQEGTIGATPLILKEQMLVVSAAPVVRASNLVGLVIAGRTVSRKAFERAAAIGGGVVGVKSKGDDWVGSGAQMSASAAVARVSRVWPELSIVSARPAPAPVEGLWVPLIIIGVVALAALVSLLTLGQPRSERIE